ncbi:DUF2267 domain-containing protein [Streptomyces griseomycini]|uniref:Uncharacterized protein (DUF2267 family) n=1 Tax=Streptomyces griseomycini TaxID=66895 RepID=A0A7W7PTR4_9ACTN|nr:DUF2267 domain-containing protein [Streptomyces griseomycini]MBB4901085.1 uncharacterized protein (DUF2267 family) [Streptomyces griseomycini]GGP88363.1 hypothetical protein GCM10010266_09450 [Streptomyces griseomycini]GGR16863.1 hypothetical protein GCM10015536_23040 [Streptomyces griseomycini]
MTTLTPQKPAHLNPEGDVPAQVSPAPAPTLSPSPESPESPSPDSGWRELVDAVRESGQYPTRSEAESVTRIVLSALGGHVVGDERVDLARALPEEAARVVASQIPATRELTAAEFVDSVAARIEGATPATARWDVSSVLSVLPPLVGDALVTRILAQLPPGYALLFGRAELVPAE